MLQHAYLLAKIGADTAENEQHSAEICQKIGNYPTGPRRAREHSGVEARAPLARRDGPVEAVRRLRRIGPRGSACVDVWGLFLSTFRRSFARFRLYRHRSLQVNARYAFFIRF